MSLVFNSNEVRYDGTFEGLLSVVFAFYEYKVDVVAIHEPNEQMGLFANDFWQINTDESKAKRVLFAIQKKFGVKECRALYRVFLSEDSHRAIMLFRYIKRLIDHEKDYRKAYHLDEVIYVKEQLKKMRREVHRMHAFVRFQQSRDDLYFSVIEPDFDVIPFIGKHFEKRYSDQRWLIFDKKRSYGIAFDLKSIAYFSWTDDVFGKQLKNILADSEEEYASWWRSYFSATNIKERKNMKLHLRHVPKRYWKYLTEKQGH